MYKANVLFQSINRLPQSNIRPLCDLALDVAFNCNLSQLKFNSFVMFAVCSLLFSIVLLFPVLEARMVASRKKHRGNSDMGDRDENTYSYDEIDLVVNSDEPCRTLEKL